MNEFLLIAGMAIATFVVRYPVLALMGRLTLPPVVLKGLRFVPVAVLTAIVVPEMVIRDQGVDFTSAYFVAGVCAIAIAWYSKNLLATIVLGMGLFFVFRAVTGA